MIRIAQIPKENRVYVDECGIKEHLQREYGRAPRGVKVEDVKRGRKFHRVNVVAAVIHGNSGTERIAPMRCQKSMTAACFEHWFENNPLERIGWTGKTIIMDNARFHRKEYLQEACGKSGVGLIFLPPYSPDFNPIEKDWANMKRELRDSVPLDNLLEAAIYKYWS